MAGADLHRPGRPAKRRLALSALGYHGYGSDAVFYRMRMTCAYALVGLDLDDDKQDDFPVPGDLKTADGAWLAPRLAAAERRVDKAFDWRAPKPITYDEWDKIAHVQDHFYAFVEDIVAKSKKDEDRAAAERCRRCDACAWSRAHPKEARKCESPLPDDVVDRKLADLKQKRKKAALERRKKEVPE